MPFGKILYKVGMSENKMGKDNGSVSNTGNYIGTPWGIILCVDYYQDEKINGRIYHRYQTEPIRWKPFSKSMLFLTGWDIRFPEQRATIL